MNKDAGIFLGGLVGTVIEIDGGQNGDCVGKFLRVRVDQDGLRWRFTGFYGDPKQVSREQSWILLRRLAGMDNLPWIIGGDFNEIMWGNEKMGGLFRNGAAMDNFREAINCSGLMDLGFVGNKYTWCNRQFSGVVIWERLDRCLCNLRWRVMFPEAVVIHRDYSSSDHRALIIDGIRKCSGARSGLNRVGSRFHFEQAWADEEECRVIVKRAWDLRVGRDNISCLQNSLDAIDEIEQEIVGFYQNLFRANVTCRESISDVLTCVNSNVSVDMNRSLCRAFSGEEVHRALIQMEPLKAPGPDGLPVLFFQKFWSEVGPGVVRAALAILNDNADFGALGEALVVLIPKVKTPVRVNEFRPISLCNVLYKLVAKTLANRLKTILDKVIAPQQSAFVPGRLITDNVVVGFECLHSLRGKRSGTSGQVALKLDMRKAYDRVEWEYLRCVMIKMGFDLGWVDKIMRCVSSASYSFLINGQARGSIKPSRGLRQGCPLSPYLFLFCAEGLSAMLSRAELNGTLHGLRVARSAPQVSHLFFADDSLIFLRASEVECVGLKKILDCYERASGQSVNYEKSAISFSPNTQQRIREQICSLFAIGEVSCHDKYLGLPSAISRNRKNVFANIKEKVWNKLQSWKHRLFSVGGREVLLKAVVQAVPTYAMSCFRLPSSLMKDIQRMIADFWWGLKDGIRKMHWLGWNHLCAPKEIGGLGFRDIEAFNRAMLAKQGWRLLTSPSSLAARVLKARYFPSSSFLNSSLGNHPSFIWRSILWGRYVLCKGLRWRVGDGKNISVYDDPWIPKPSTFRVISPRWLPAGVSVAGLISADGNWCEEVIRSYFTAEEADCIMSIPLSRSPCPDSFLWHYDKQGIFSVRSAYKLAAAYMVDQQGSSSGGPNPWWRKLWSLKIPSKIKFFGWKLSRNILPTRENLWRRKIAHSNLCPLCNKTIETSDHILWSCSKIAVFWHDFPFFVALNRLQVRDFAARIFWVKSVVGSKYVLQFLVAAWFLWGWRNQMVHGGKPILTDCWFRAAAFISELQQDSSSSQVNQSHQVAPSLPAQVWSAPPPNSFKINVDASVMNGKNCFGIGLICRDNSGMIMAAKSMLCVGSVSVIVAEARAVLEGILLGLELNLSPLFLESDSLSVVHLCKGELLSRADVGVLIHDIHVRVASRDDIFLSFIPRSCNSAAHCLAKRALTAELSEFWDALFPAWLACIASFEAASSG
ncbi:hypothetical protein ACOSQ2_021208 [Xanthoceras sorbifolium]